MTHTVRTKIVKIGNSRGIRIPRTLLEQAGLENEVEMTLDDGKLVIQPTRQPRQGWEAQFTYMAQSGDDRLLDETIPMDWDEADWEW